MTATLSRYAQAVESNLKGIIAISTGILGACPVCQNEHGMGPRAFYGACERGEIPDEGNFSWSSCESCGSTLGGNRYDAHGLYSNGGLIHFSVCSDCVQYLNYGDEPTGEEDDGWAAATAAWLAIDDLEDED